MLKAIDVYRKEILELKKLLSEYRVLKLRHIYKYFYDKDGEIIKKIIKYLVRNGQAYVDVENSFIAINKDAYMNEMETKLLVSFDVMLLFREKLTYHTRYEFPYQICFLTGEQQYQIVYVDTYDEQHINAVFENIDEENVKYLVVVQELEQIKKINIKNVYRYCIVDEIGHVNTYVVEGEENCDEKSDTKEINRMQWRIR